MKYGEIDHRTSNLQLDVSFLWSTNFEARFQVYGGVGLGAGFSFNAETSVSVFENSYTYYRDYDYYYGPTESERFRNKSGFSGNIYLPLGLDWRLGKKGFWESIHIVSEFRPALAVYSIPELDTYVAPSFGFLTGIKVGW